MKSKGLDFPDNFMDIFGFHRVEEEEQISDDTLQIEEGSIVMEEELVKKCDNCNNQFPLNQLCAYKILRLCKKCFSSFTENNDSKIHLKITNFTNTPGGRYIKDGPCSGEEYFETILEPALLNYEEVLLDLDGTYGYPIGFLDQVFGSLTKEQTMKIKFVSEEDPELIKRIQQIMGEHCDRT